MKFKRFLIKFPPRPPITFPCSLFTISANILKMKTYRTIAGVAPVLLSKKLFSAILAVSVLTLVGCNAQKEEVPAEIIVVRIPPYFDAKLTPGENHCVFSEWWHPSSPVLTDKEVLDACKGAPLPNDGVPLMVSLREDDSIGLNNQNQGSLSNLNSVTVGLAEIFDERAKNNAYEPHTNNVEKSVMIKIVGTNRSYADLFAVADAVKKSGASSIILMLDGHLPAQLIEPVIVVRK